MTTPNSPVAGSLLRHAKACDAEWALSRLLAQQFPATATPAVPLGRYRILMQAIERHPPLLDALRQGDGAVTAREWAVALGRFKSDAPFLHAIAVLCRERACDDASDGPARQQMWVASTALWALLLASKEFWGHFCANRVRGPGKAVVADLPDAEVGELMRGVTRDILAHHGSEGSRDLAGGRQASARVHLRCLHICAQGEQALHEALSESGISCKLGLDGERAALIRETAAAVIDAWTTALVADATKATEETVAIQNLPKGIQKAYERGIQQLTGFMGLGVPTSRVLRTALGWYNDWCYDLYVMQQAPEIARLMAAARGLADLLAPICTPARGHLAENQVLSQHFLLRGFVEDEPDQAIRHFEEALAWNLANANAEKLLGGQREAAVSKHIGTAIERAKASRFEEAHEIVLGVEQRLGSGEQINEARAAIHFLHAQALMQEKKFKAALKQACEGQKWAPDAKGLRELARELAELAPEEDAARELDTAQQAFEADRYDQAIELACRIAPHSRFFGRARELAAGAHFRKGLACARRDPPAWEDALTHLGMAHGMVGDDEARSVITQNMANAHFAKGATHLQTEPRQWDAAIDHLRQAHRMTLDAQEKACVCEQFVLVLEAFAKNCLNEGRLDRARRALDEKRELRLESAQPGPGHRAS